MYSVVRRGDYPQIQLFLGANFHARRRAVWRIFAMRTKTSESLDLIAKRLREEWCDLENLALPEHIRRLVTELERNEKKAQVGVAHNAR
jgi:hypothetical protein